MSIKNIPRVDGVATVDFGYSSMDRNSPAWSPITGAAYRANKARIESGIIPIFKCKPKVYYTFPEPTVFMGYDVTHPAVWMPTGKYLTGVGGRMEQFEAAYCPPFEKILLGQSSGTTTFPKDVFAYRLTQTGAPDPLATKHCLITCMVHGNEAGGLDGAFKAIEIIGTNSDFANFRAEYTLLFVPCMNPDGFYSNLRNLEVIGPNLRTVNLNRNWDWFWSEYVESSSESKGTIPNDSAEAQNILTYYASVVAAGGSFGALFDLHATETGVGARYQSRDRIWRDILYGPNEGGEVPANYLTYYLDHFIWRINRALITKRCLEYGGPDNFVRYCRSRFSPHFHAYFSSLGSFCMIAEEVKWYGAKNGTETIASSCNYRLDYIISFCKAITTDNWEFKDGVLIEQATENILTNGEWQDWSVEDNGTQRPAYTSLARASSERITKDTGEKFFEDNGEAIKVTSDIDVVLPDTSEYNVVAYSTNIDNTKQGAAGVIFPGGLVTNGFFFYPFADPSAYKTFTLAVHTSQYAAGLFGDVAFTYYALGGGTSALAGASTKVTKIVISASYVLTETALAGTGFTARMAAGCCFRRGTAGYLVGGQDAAGARLASMGTFSMTTELWNASTQSLPAAVRGCFCAYSTANGNLYIFGGDSAGGFVTTICEWDVSTDTLIDLTATLGIALPKALAYAGCAYEPDDGVIYIYGGQENGGAMSSAFYVFDPADYSISEVTLYQNLSDDEDVEEEAEAFVPWEALQGRWGATYCSGPKLITLVGGRVVNTAGAVQNGVYNHDPTDNTINLVRSTSWDYGYMRYGYAINVGTEPSVWVPGDDFVTQLADYENPLAAWAIVGVTCVCATAGPVYYDATIKNAIGNTAGSSAITTCRDQMHEVYVSKSAAGDSIVQFGIVVRGYYNNRATEQPVTVTGVIIYETSESNSSGTAAPYPQARLRYVAATTLLYYRAPNEASEGTAVNIGAGGLFTLYADTLTKYIKVFVVAAALPVGNVTESLDQIIDGSLTDGYRLLYTEADTTWTLQHVYGTATRTLGTYVGSALTDVGTRVKISAVGQSPTTIRAWISGTERITATDDTVEQIVADDNNCAVEGCAGVATLIFDDLRAMHCPLPTMAVEEFGDTTFDQFDDPAGVWTVDAVTGYGYAGAPGGPLVCNAAATYNNHKVECVFLKSGAGDIGSFSLSARATYTVAQLTRGYTCIMDPTATSFSFYRVIGGVPTLLSTVALVIGTNQTKLVFKVTGDNPVRLQLVYSTAAAWWIEAQSASLECYDYSELRITDNTACAVTAVNDASTVYVRQLMVQSGGENLERFAHSMSVKSDPTNVSGYTRVNINPDDRYNTVDSITRYIRDYYTLAPKISYWWYRLRTDFGEAATHYTESALRIYQRVYKHNQKFLMDGMHLQKGSLIASSWQHPDAPRLAEVLTFSNVVNANACRVSFYWLPTCCFLDIREGTLELFRISVDATNYIRLYAQGYSGTDLNQRNYYLAGWLSGPHDPEFILEKVRGGVQTDAVSIINYWNHDFRTGGSEREDNVIKFTISHFATTAKNGIFELAIDNYGSIGVKRSYVDLTPFAGYTGSLVYRGAGFYSPPEIEDTVQLARGRIVPASRRGLLGRVRNNDRHALIAGDRDPTNGELVYQPYVTMAGKTFGLGDSFTRANSSNLGSWWNTHVPYFSSRSDVTALKGFDILTNRAVGYGNSVVYWNYHIGHADTIITAIGKISANGDKIGVIGRYDDSSWDKDLGTWRGLTCYAAELRQVTNAQAELALVRWHLGVAVDLDTQVFNWYVTGTDYTITLGLNGSALVAGVTDGVNSEVASATDSNFQRAGFVGMLVSAAASASFASFSVDPDFYTEVE